MIRGMKKILSASIINLIVISPTFAACAGFTSVLSGNCILDYNGWMREIWTWTLLILVPVSVLVLSAAGFLYMTSAGNPSRIDAAKKMIFGVLAGIAVLILARVILFNIVGVDESVWR